AGQPIQVVERAFAEPRGLRRESLARRRDELRGHVDAEIVEVGPPRADQLEHDPGAAPDVEHRIHALEQIDGLEPGGMVPAFVAHPQEAADRRGRDPAPGLFDPRGPPPWSTGRRPATTPTRRGGPPMRPANRTYAAPDTPTATSNDARSWIQT